MPRQLIDQNPALMSTVHDPIRGGGWVAETLIQNNMNLESLRTNAMLPEEAWRLLDTTATQAFTMNLPAVADLRSRGLTLDLGDMGTMVYSYERLSQMNEAEMSMDASLDAEQAALDRSGASVPVPVIFKEWQLGLRTILAARRGGISIDTDHAMAAGKVVAEKLEQLLFNGNTTVYGSMPIYGYRTHPSRNTGSGSDFGTIGNVYTTIEAMLDAMMVDGAPAPYILYLHQTQFNQMNHINTSLTPASSPRSLILQEHPELADIKYSGQMTDGEAVLVSMSPMTVRLGIAEDLINVQWDSLGGLTSHFRTMTVAVPIIKSDYEGRSGIVHYTGV